MNKNLTVLTAPDPERLAGLIGAHLCSHLAGLQAGGTVPTLALTGGGIGVAALVAAAKRTDGPNWQRIEYYFGDERYLPFDDPERNAVQARAALLDPRGVAEDRIHEMPSAGALSVDQAAAAYPLPDRFDLVLLGMGEDGHVASLFPGRFEVLTTQRLVSIVDSPKPPPERISLSLAEIRRAHHVWLLVSGTRKAAALARAAAGFDSTDLQVLQECPAAGAVGTHATQWFVDTDAAAELPTTPS